MAAAAKRFSAILALKIALATLIVAAFVVSMVVTFGGSAGVAVVGFAAAVGTFYGLGGGLVTATVLGAITLAAATFFASFIVALPLAAIINHFTSGKTKAPDSAQANEPPRTDTIDSLKEDRSVNSNLEGKPEPAQPIEPTRTDTIDSSEDSSEIDSSEDDRQVNSTLKFNQVLVTSASEPAQPIEPTRTDTIDFSKQDNHNQFWKKTYIKPEKLYDLSRKRLNILVEEKRQHQSVNNIGEKIKEDQDGNLHPARAISFSHFIKK